MAGGRGYTPYGSGTHVLRMGLYDEQLDRYIRTAVQNAGAFTAVPGWGGVVMGVIGVAAAAVAAMRTGTPRMRLARISTSGRRSSIRGTMNPWSAPQASASSSDAASSSPSDHRAAAANNLKVREGFGGVAFMKTLEWREL